jgi:hypothetical protein
LGWAHLLFCLSCAGRNYKGASSYIKSFLRKGQALLGLGANRLAADTLEKGEQHLLASRKAAGTCFRQPHTLVCCWGLFSLGLPLLFDWPVLALTPGLEIDPFNPDMKKALMDAQDGILRVNRAAMQRQPARSSRECTGWQCQDAAVQRQLGGFLQVFGQLHAVSGACFLLQLSVACVALGRTWLRGGAWSAN